MNELAEFIYANPVLHFALLWWFSYRVYCLVNP